MTPDVNVFVIDFKNTSSNEVVTQNEDLSYSIFINSRLSHEKQLQMYQHAMKHIQENDFEKQDVQTIEAVAHEISKQPDVQPIPAERFEEKLRELRKRHAATKEAIRRDEERVRFIQEHCDLFARAEHYYLYGKDL